MTCVRPANGPRTCGNSQRCCSSPESWAQPSGRSPSSSSSPRRSPARTRRPSSRRDAGSSPAWFGGTREGATDVGIWVSRRATASGRRRSKWPHGVQPDGARHPDLESGAVPARDGALTLFYKVGPSPQTWWGMVRTSRDGGRTWSDAAPPAGRHPRPIKNKPVQLADGTLSRRAAPSRPNGRARGACTSSARPTAARRGRACPAAERRRSADRRDPAEHPRSSAAAGCRRSAARGRGGVRDVVDDGGKTWTPLALTTLPNPSAGTDAVTLQRRPASARLQPHARRDDAAERRDLARRQAWEAALVLESEAGEYSYPAVIQTATGSCTSPTRGGAAHQARRDRPGEAVSVACDEWDGNPRSGFALMCGAPIAIAI